MDPYIIDQIEDENLSLTLEWGRGETYRSGRPTLYGHGRYKRSSVLAGQSKRVFLECWDNLDEARAALAEAGLKYQDLTDTGGSTHRPVAEMTAHLPDRP